MLINKNTEMAWWLLIFNRETKQQHSIARFAVAMVARVQGSAFQLTHHRSYRHEHLFQDIDRSGAGDGFRNRRGGG
jgi:hypothetical protein